MDAIGQAAPFVLRFGEYAFCNSYTCIGYLLPAIGDICQLEGVCDSVCSLVSELGNMHFVIY